MTYVVYGPGNSKPEDIILGVIILVLTIINILGNTLVVLVIVKDRFMRTPINYLLLNLAIADMMVGAFSLPSTAFNNTFTHPSGMAGDILCKFLTGMSLAWMAQMASAFSLVFIAVERYYAVMHPLDLQRKLTITEIKITVSACWLVCALLSIPEFLTTIYRNDNSVCEMRWENNWEAKAAYSLIWFIFGGALPTMVMSVLYSKVIRSLWFQREETARNFTRQAVLKSRKKISQTMLTVSVIYAITCMPNHIIFVVESFSNWVGPSLAHKFLKCLLVLNSSVNPFVYSLQSYQFNKSVKKLFDCNTGSRTGSAIRGVENEIPKCESSPTKCKNVQLVSIRPRETK